MQTKTVFLPSEAILLRSNPIKVRSIRLRIHDDLQKERSILC